MNGVPVGEKIGPDGVPLPTKPEGAGSIIALIATDAPLLPSQCERLARRAGFGIARTGGMGEHSSGDFGFLRRDRQPRARDRRGRDLAEDAERRPDQPASTRP